MTDSAGASDYVQGGVVAYANEVKSSVLGVPEETLRAHGAVSEETVRAMASGVRRVCDAECGIAITGVAGPGGGSEERPVGTVWIAAETPDASHARRLRLLGHREEIRERSAYAALDLLRRMLLGVLAE
jgi:PncC family amidohydrolase